MEGKQLPGYVALVLTDESSWRLRELAVHVDVYCRHVTLAFRPSSTVWAKFEPLVGQRFEVEVLGTVQDQRGQAALVKLPEGLGCENTYPFITISCAHGTNPAYSKNIVGREVQRVQDRLVVEGTVKFIPF